MSPSPAQTPLPHARPGQTRAGMWYALAAFGVWGLFPAYFRLLAPAGALEIICHRVIWSVPVVAFLLTRGQGWRQLRRALARPRVLPTLLASALMVSANWLGFVYAVETRQVLQASLGYFINPLVNVVMSVLIMGERLRPGQVAAVLLALAGTLVLALGAGQAPWLALFLAVSFGLYGLLRKRVDIDALGGLFTETVLLTPLALLYLAWLASQGGLVMASGPWSTRALLLSAGLATSLPLVWFARAARRISLTTLGLIQYVTPTMQFSLAVFLFGETFTATHLLSFGLIWSGLAVFMAEMLLQARRQGAQAWG